MKTFFLLFPVLVLAFSIGCDNSSKKKNNNNVNNINNINNTNNTNNQNCVPACEEWETCNADSVCELATGRCTNNSHCPAGTHVCDLGTHTCMETIICDPVCETWETCVHTGEAPTCIVPEGWTWIHLPIAIDDPIVNGTSLMVPVDNITLALDGASGRMFTSFGHDINDPSLSHLWHFDTTSGIHAKTQLGGSTFSEDENFCMNENWCQFLNHHSPTDEILLTGPRASAIMFVNPETFVSRMVSTSGTRPANSHISHSHVFDPESGHLYVFGALTPSGFGSTLFRMDPETGVWADVANGLPNRADNCLALNPSENAMYSFGGRTTPDGGNTSSHVNTFLRIDLSNGNHVETPMPGQLGARVNLSCVHDPARNIIFVFGGAVILDNWDEGLNTYFNDLWVYHPDTGDWTLLLENKPGGTLSEPDQYGDRSFTGFPEGPNFGKRNGRMLLDPKEDRLWLVGSVPVFTHEQPYFLPLSVSH